MPNATCGATIGGHRDRDRRVGHVDDERSSGNHRSRHLLVGPDDRHEHIDAVARGDRRAPRRRRPAPRARAIPPAPPRRRPTTPSGATRPRTSTSPRTRSTRAARPTAPRRARRWARLPTGRRSTRTSPEPSNLPASTSRVTTTTATSTPVSVPCGGGAADEAVHGQPGRERDRDDGRPPHDRDPQEVPVPPAASRARWARPSRPSAKRDVVWARALPHGARDRGGEEVQARFERTARSCRRRPGLMLRRSSLPTTWWTTSSRSRTHCRRTSSSTSCPSTSCLRRALLRACGLLAVAARAGLGLRTSARPVVGLVEAAALERDADRPEHLAQGPGVPAPRAVGQRVVGERLDDLEVLAAVLAAVLVGGHLASGSIGRPARAGTPMVRVPSVPSRVTAVPSQRCRRRRCSSGSPSCPPT